MPIENTGPIRLRGAAGDGRTDINEEINGNVTDTDVSLGTLNTARYATVAEGSTPSGRSMSEMRGYAAFESLFPSTEADGALGESLITGGTNEYFRRTNSLSGNSKTFTLSFWIKINKVDTAYKTLLSAGDGGTDRAYFFFYNNKFHIYEYNGSAYTLQHEVDQIIDTSGWYHFVLAFDTTKDYTPDRTRVYVNGIEVPLITTTNYDKNDESYIGRNNTFAIGYDYGLGSRFFPGVIADFKFIDGQQLRPDSFGELVQGIWIPKAFNTPSTDTIVTSNRYIDFRPRNQSDISGSTITNNGSLSNGTLESGIDLLQNNYGILDLGTSEKISGTSWNLWSTSTDNTDTTVEFWINIDSAFSSGFATLIGANGGSSGEGPYRLILRGYGNNQYFIDQFRMFGSNNYYTNPDTYPRVTLFPNTWYHIVGTYTAGSNKILKAYLNGTLIYTDTASTISYSNSYASSDFAINQYRDGNPLGLNGKYGDIRVYSAALTDTEVLQNYNATKHYYTYGLNGFWLPLNNTSTGSIVDDSTLKLHLDASNSSSYGGSGTTWSDLTSNGNNATLYGSPNYLSTNGGYFDLDGSNDYIVFPGSTISHTSDQDFTIETWLKFASVPTSSSHNFIGSTNSNNRSPVNAWFYGTGSGLAISLERYFNSTQYYSSGYNSNVIYPFVANKWYQIVITYNSNGRVVTVYVNGKQEDNSYTLNISNGSQGTTSYDMTIGNYSGTSFNNFDIAQFRIYNDILTAQEVITNYRATQGNYEQVSTVDISGNANSFTATNIDATDHIKDEPLDNYATLDPNYNSSPYKSAITLSNGNLTASQSTTGNIAVYDLITSTLAMDNNASDGYYWEVTDTHSSTYAFEFGITSENTSWQHDNSGNYIQPRNSYMVYQGYNDAANTYRLHQMPATGTSYTLVGSYSSTRTSGQIWMFAFKNGKLYIGKNGTWLESCDPATEANPFVSGLTGKWRPSWASMYNTVSTTFNFGQNPFSYSIPAGYKTLNTKNLPAPAFDPDGATPDKPSNYFKAVTYQGNGGTQGEAYGYKDGSRAAVFNGSSSYISTGINFSTLPNTKSISMWIKSSGSSSIGFGGMDGSSVNNGLFQFDESGGVVAYIPKFGGYHTASASTVNTNAWNHFLVTDTNVDGNVKIYINGSEVTVTKINSTVYVNNTNMQIGRQMKNNGTTFWQTGSIDEVRIYDKVLNSTEAGYLADDDTANIDAISNLVAYYDMEGDAVDEAGTSGKIEEAGIFNGSSSYINFGDSPELRLTGSYSVSGWANFDSFAGTQRLITKDNANDYSGGYSLNINSTNIYWQHNNGSATDVAYAHSFSTGTWYHFTITYDSSTTTNNLKLYINGSNVSTSNAASPINGESSNYLFFGTYGSTSPSGQYFNGKLDQIRFFNKALDETNNGEVTTLYNEPSNPSTASTKDIFNDGSGVALYELNGNALDTGKGAIDSGQSAVFNGSSSYIDLPDFSSIVSGASANFSVSLWVNLNNLTGNHTLFQLSGNNTVYTHLTLQVNSSGNFAIDNYGSALSFSGLSSISANTWYHLLLVNTGSSAVLYVNNSASNTLTHNITFAGDYSAIGGRFVTGSIYSADVTEGKIDQVRIYSSALSSSDVTNLYNETNVPTANLVAHYKLDGNGNDETTNYNATSVNNVTYSDPAEYPVYNGTPTNVTYSYNGTESNVTFTQDKPYGNIDVGFKPDFVWIKNRDTDYHLRVIDSVRGLSTDGLLYSNLTNAADDLPTVNDTFTSFDSNGFTLGSGIGLNQSNYKYIAWCWKAGGNANKYNVDGTGYTTLSAAGLTGGTLAESKVLGISTNTEAGFSIIQYDASSGVSAGQTIETGLASDIELMIIKRTDSTGSWVIVNSISNEYYTFSQAAGVNITYTDYVDGTKPKIYDFATYVHYCFHSVDGFSKIGSYTGNGSSDGPFVYTGFQPAWIMVKSASAGNSYNNWFIYDNARTKSNATMSGLTADLPNAEFNNSAGHLTFSNGFKINSSGGEFNTNGHTYIYMAFAEDPVKYSNGVATLGDGNEFIQGGNYPEDNFAATLYTGNGGTNKIITGVNADLVWVKSRAAGSHMVTDSVRGNGKEIYPDLTNQEGIVNRFSLTTNGFDVTTTGYGNANNINYIAWSWKAAGNANTYNILENGTVTSSASASTLGLDAGTITPDGISANKDNGFSIIKWTGNGISGSTISHGLDYKPELIITKGLTNPTSWVIGIGGISGFGVNDYLTLTTATKLSSSTFYQDYSADTFKVGVSSANEMNKNSSNEYISYLWRSVPGFSKIGSYNGNTSASISVYTGFEPAWLMVKLGIGNASSYTGWVIFDNKRDINTDQDNPLYANASYQEGLRGIGSGSANDSVKVQFTDTGFIVDPDLNRDGETNEGSGSTYIYMAFAHR